jgi:hypothetical protein
VEYTTVALSAAPAPPSAVVLIKVVSSRLVPPEMLTTANSIVPALSRARTTMRDCCADTVPKVEPLDTTTEIAEPTVRVLTVPLVIGVARKSKAQGLSVTVRALEATEAVTE